MIAVIITIMKVLKFIASIVITFSAAAIGSLATYANIPTWYASLEKPIFNPPNWVFGPVWTVLYIAMAVALYLVWVRPNRNKKRAVIAFAVQLTLNALWSIVFFGLHLPWLAVVVILALLVSIIFTIREFYIISRPASYLLVPYVLWVSFASILTISVASLN